MKVSLKALRANRNLTLTEASKALGIGRNTLLLWEKNTRFPNTKQLVKICEVYGCRVEDIFLPTDLAKS